MEGVIDKVRWEVRLRADKHTPHTLHHPAWRIRREIDRVMHEITLPIHAQLHEDAEWKE